MPPPSVPRYAMLQVDPRRITVTRVMLGGELSEERGPSCNQNCCGSWIIWPAVFRIFWESYFRAVGQLCSRGCIIYGLYDVFGTFLQHGLHGKLYQGSEILLATGPSKQNPEHILKTVVPDHGTCTPKWIFAHTHTPNTSETSARSSLQERGTSTPKVICKEKLPPSTSSHQGVSLCQRCPGTKRWKIRLASSFLLPVAQPSTALPPLEKSGAERSFAP